MTLISDKRISWPEGNLDKQNFANAAAYEATIWNAKTIVELTPTEAGTLNLVIDSELEDGAELHVFIDQDAAGRDISLGTNMEGTDMAGAANAKQAFRFIYNKTTGLFRRVA